jgi:hypothetical protein
MMSNGSNAFWEQKKIGPLLTLEEGVLFTHTKDFGKDIKPGFVDSKFLGFVRDVLLHRTINQPTCI